MLIDTLIEHLGEAGTLALAGALLGLLFGAAAQRSRLCLRAAVADAGGLAVWLIVWAAAIVATQCLVLADWLDTSTARSLAARGSLSGAVAGGALFGLGMVLARGCASRLMVRAAQGEARAWLPALVFATVAAASLSGPLAPLRLALAEAWTVEGGSARDLLAGLGIGHAGGALVGAALLAAGVVCVRRQRMAPSRAAAAAIAGLAVALGWLATWQVARRAFDVQPVQSLSITGPASELALALVSPPAWSFNLALLPGVLVGAFLAAMAAREARLEGLAPAARWPRELGGAALMGFGGMLAGGCSIGAGLSGTAAFALTAWVALAAMWAAGMLADTLLDKNRSG
jgi:uncharacterized membrane protein YedE/YeeE